MSCLIVQPLQKRSSSTLYTVIKRNAQILRNGMITSFEHSPKFQRLSIATTKPKYFSNNFTNPFPYVAEQETETEEPASMKRAARALRSFTDDMREKAGAAPRRKGAFDEDNSVMQEINNLLNGYAKLCQFDKCEALFHKMEERYDILNDYHEVFEPTVTTFECILNCISNCIDSSAKDDEYKSKMKSHAFKYYTKMEQEYEVYDRFHTCTELLMNVCLKCNDMETFMKVFEEKKHSDTYYNNQMHEMVIGALFDRGRIDEALQLFTQHITEDEYAFPDLSPDHNEPYSLDLHTFELAPAVIAIRYKLAALCDVIAACDGFIIPSVSMVVISDDPFNKMFDETGKQLCYYQNGLFLKQELPLVLKDESLFYPPLAIEADTGNKNVLKLDDECLLRYLAYQLKMDIDELRPRFRALNETKE